MPYESEYSKILIAWKFLLRIACFLVSDALRFRWSIRHTALAAALMVGVVIMSVPVMLLVVAFLLPMMIIIWTSRRLGISVQIQ